MVPPDQSFEHSYCGVFRFRFWHFGDWVEVSGARQIRSSRIYKIRYYIAGPS